MGSEMCIRDRGVFSDGISESSGEADESPEDTAEELDWNDV